MLITLTCIPVLASATVEWVHPVVHLFEVLHQVPVVVRAELAHGAIPLSAGLVDALDVVVQVAPGDGNVAARGAVEPLCVRVELFHVFHDRQSDPKIIQGMNGKTPTRFVA